MSDLGDLYREHKSERQAKRASNRSMAAGRLALAGVPFTILTDAHFRVGEFDFWPGTGLFIHRASGKRGRGILNLLKKVRPQ